MASWYVVCPDFLLNPFLTITLCNLTLYPLCPARTRCQLLGDPREQIWCQQLESDRGWGCPTVCHVSYWSDWGLSISCCSRSRGSLPLASGVGRMDVPKTQLLGKSCMSEASEGLGR